MNTKGKKGYVILGMMMLCCWTACQGKESVLFSDNKIKLSVPADTQTMEQAGHDLVVVDNLEIRNAIWAEQGSLSFLMRLEGTPDTREFNLNKGEYLGVKFLKGPAFDLHLYFTHMGAGGIGVIPHSKDPEEIRHNAPLIHMAGNKTYLITLTWNLHNHQFNVYYNGIYQGDISHWSEDTPPLILSGESTTLHSHFDKDPQLKLWLGGFQLSDAVWSEETIADQPLLKQLPPLTDEGRVVFDHPLDLSDCTLTSLYEADFSQPQNIVREQDLFSDGVRIREPEKTDEWVLEGPEKMLMEARENGLYMETPLPDDRKRGHWVLWLNRTFPDNILVEYSFTPRTDRQGLNILFFSAHNPGGDSLFDLDLPYRGGDFGKYIIDAINSYHISPWATDGQNLRATSNMRKNAGFHLVARGNDVIGGAGAGPHTVRILKHGNKVRMESNGVLCLAYDDNGETFGPVYGTGNIGIRFMAHTGYATLHSLKVYRVE